MKYFRSAVSNPWPSGRRPRFCAARFRFSQ